MSRLFERRRPAVTVVAGVLWCCAALLAQPLPPISAVEAAHLVERRVPRLSVTGVRSATVRGSPGYLVEGVAGKDRCRAEVDARTARTLRITMNGTPIYEWPGVIVVAHRGSVHLAPENTLAAIEKAIEQGADLIEIDIRQTRDGHLVLMHDATVDRTTDGSGRVADMTLAQIKRLDAGSWFHPRFAGERVPTLAEALQAMEGRALPDLDIKDVDPPKLVAVLRRFRLLGKVTLHCSDAPLLKAAAAAADPGFLIRPTIPFGRAALGPLLEDFDPPIVNIDWPQFSERLVRDIHLHGRKAFLNTMGPNDTEWGLSRVLEAGADYVQTDRLDILVPMLERLEMHR